MTARSHVAAFKALVAGNEAPFPVYVSKAPTDAGSRYCVLHPDQGTAEASSYDGESGWRTFRIVTHCFGTTAEQAQAVYDAVEANVLDATPTVSGWSCTPVRKESSLPIEPDDDKQPTVFLARDAWVYSSVPA